MSSRSLSVHIQMIGLVLFANSNTVYAFTLFGKDMSSYLTLSNFILLLVSSIVPITAVAYAKFRQHIRHKQLNFYLECLCDNDKEIIKENIEIFAHDASLTSHLDLNEKERSGPEGFRAARFRLAAPVILATVMTWVGLSFLIHAETISSNISEYNYFFGGMEVINQDSRPINFLCEDVSKAYERDEFFLKKCKSINALKITDCELITENDLLKSICFNTKSSHIKKYQKGALLMMGMASLGAVMWGLLNIIRRYIKYDITTGVYYSMAIRIFIASVVAVVIYHSMDALTDGLFTLLADSNGAEAAKGENISSILPSFALLIGMIPERGIHLIKQRFSAFHEESDGNVMALPLSKIEGITQHEIVRLNEISIDNCYVLAEQRVIPLLLSTPFTPNLIINFIAQAKLCAFFPDAIDELREMGIKNIFHIYIPKYGEKDAITEYEKLLGLDTENKLLFEQHIVDETRIKLSHINHVIAEIYSDWETQELYGFSKKLSNNKKCNKAMSEELIRRIKRYTM